MSLPLYLTFRICLYMPLRCTMECFPSILDQCMASCCNVSLSDADIFSMNYKSNLHFYWRINLMEQHFYWRIFVMLSHFSRGIIAHFIHFRGGIWDLLFKETFHSPQIYFKETFHSPQKFVYWIIHSPHSFRRCFSLFLYCSFYVHFLGLIFYKDGMLIHRFMLSAIMLLQYQNLPQQSYPSMSHQSTCARWCSHAFSFTTLCFAVISIAIHRNRQTHFMIKVSLTWPLTLLQY